MSTTTASMGLTKPDLNDDPGVWDTHLNASLDLIDVHDHTTGKGVPVPSTGIGINADLTMAGYSLTNLRAACFTVQASFSTARALWVKTSDNELYFRNASGTDIQITSGSGLNLSATGGITGDYAAASAALYYDDTAEAYRFLEAAPTPNDWSYIKAGGVDIYEHASGISNFVRWASPAALAASYTLTLGAALPGATALVQVSSAGAVTYSNTIVEDVAAAAGKHISVSTTGRFKHGELVRTTNGVIGTPTYTAAAATWENATGYAISVAAGGGFLHVPMAFDEGERVKSITFARYGDAAANVTIDVYIVTAANSAGSIGGTTLTAPAAAWGDTTIDITDTVIGSGECFYVRFNASAANIRIGNIRVTYDRP